MLTEKRSILTALQGTGKSGEFVKESALWFVSLWKEIEHPCYSAIVKMLHKKNSIDDIGAIASAKDSISRIFIFWINSGEATKFLQSIDVDNLEKIDFGEVIEACVNSMMGWFNSIMASLHGGITMINISNSQHKQLTVIIKGIVAQTILSKKEELRGIFKKYIALQE